MPKGDLDWQERAADFKRRLEMTGLGPTAFAKEAGLSRSVVYHLSTGQKPRSAEQQGKMEAAFERLRKR